MQEINWLSLFFSFKGKIPRSQFVIVACVNFVFLLGFNIQYFFPSMLEIGVVVIQILSFVLYIWTYFAGLVKRVRDMGVPPAWMWVALIMPLFMPYIPYLTFGALGICAVWPSAKEQS